jgi:hypothetical protein
MPPYSPDGSVDHGAPCVRCRCPRWKHKHDGYCRNGACACVTFRDPAYRDPSGSSVNADANGRSERPSRG